MAINNKNLMKDLFGPGLQFTITDGEITES